MTKKQVKAIITILQAILVGDLFLPVGREINPAKSSQPLTLSVFGMVRRYAGMGFSNDALLFIILSFCLPVLVIIFVFSLKERNNFGTAACLCALYTMVAACFFSAAKGKMVDFVSMTGLHYIIIIVALISVAFAICGFFIAAPAGGDESGQK